MVQRYHFNDEYSGIHKKGNFVAYTDYAALEAERDEARVAATKYKAASDELAARLRAVREAIDFDMFEAASGRDHHIGIERAKRARTALSGPVPECRACAEMHKTIKEMRLRFRDWWIGTIDNKRFRMEMEMLLARPAEGRSKSGPGCVECGWTGYVLKVVQPCGCRICVCDDEERCHGCGADVCAEHENNNRLWVDGIKEKCPSCSPPRRRGKP